MKRLMSGLSASALLFSGAPLLAQAAAQQQEEVVCQLLNNCGAGDAATSGDPAAPTPRAGGRTSSTRGFSLARPTVAPASNAPAGSGAASGRGSAAASNRTASAKPRANPGGGYDLNVTFRSGSADLTSAFKSRAEVFASALKDQRLAGRRVRIEGHTDSVGNPDSNRDLSQRRARTVADLLIAAGVEASRLDVAGYGSSQPLTGLASTAAAQRRVVAVLAN
jgi:OOP family OmpA-OmpF porin